MVHRGVHMVYTWCAHAVHMLYVVYAWTNSKSLIDQSEGEYQLFYAVDFWQSSKHHAFYSRTFTYITHRIIAFNVTLTSRIEQTTRPGACENFSFQQDYSYVRCGGEKRLKQSAEGLHTVVTSFLVILQVCASFQKWLPEATAHHETQAHEKEGGTSHHNYAVHEVVRARTSVEVKIVDCMS